MRFVLVEVYRDDESAVAHKETAHYKKWRDAVADMSADPLIYQGNGPARDDVARTDSTGRLIFAGHLGTIYQASNAVFLGRGTARTLRLLPDGRVFSDRAAQKIRAGEPGWKYSVRQLEAFGATEAPEDGDARRAWLKHWTPILTRPLRHPGCLKYGWSLDKSARLPPSLPYPKVRALDAQPVLFAA